MIIIIILLSLLIIYSLARYQANDICSLTNDGWVLYHSPSCGYCVKQLKEISWKRIWLNEVECTSNRQQCSEMGINVYPTWINVKSGARYEGSINGSEIYTVLSNL